MKGRHVSQFAVFVWPWGGAVEWMVEAWWAALGCGEGRGALEAIAGKLMLLQLQKRTPAYHASRIVASRRGAQCNCWIRG
jgi:hypothetical protein